MGKIAVEVKDTVVEAKLETFLESCFSRSNNSMHVGHLFGQLLRNKSEEESLDTIEGMLEVAASVAFKRKLSSLACERYPKERSAESVGLSQEIVNDLVGEIVTRSVRQAISEIASAISKKDAAATLVAVNKATEAAKKLCDRFFFVEENFENEKVTRLTFEKFVSNPYAFERARTKNNEKDNSSGASRGGWEMISLSNAIAKGSFFAKVFVHFPKVDDKQLALDKAVYGAKGANLLALKKASETIQSFMEKIGEAFTVPDFTLIPVTAYDADRNDLSKNQELKNAYEWVRGRRVMIRSSALHSEDGEHLGAGVYSSFLLPESASFELFCEVVGKVYESVDTPLAREYRNRIGCTENEKMGVIIQEYVEGAYDEPRGHINTVRPQMPDVCDVVSQSRHIPEYQSGEPYSIENYSSNMVPMLREVLQDQFVG